MNHDTLLAQASFADLARPETDLIRAEDWCAAHHLTEDQTQKVISAQQRKAVVDLEYMLMVGEIVKEIRRTLDAGLGDKCCKEVLGLSERTTHRYEHVYDIKQAIPELNQSSAEAIGIVALASMESSLRSYEMSEEEKRAIITQTKEDQKKISEKTIADLKQALQRDALRERTQAVNEAVNAAREGDAQAIANLAEERRKLKEETAKLLEELREARKKLESEAKRKDDAKLLSSIEPAQVAESVVNKPKPGSVTDNATPPLSFLRDDPSGQAKVKETRDPLMNWMIRHRSSMESAIKDFNEIYDEIQRDYTNRHGAYKLLWEAIDIISPETEKSRWRQAFGVNRSKTTERLSDMLHVFANRVKHLPTLTSMGAESFRVEE